MVWPDLLLAADIAFLNAILVALAIPIRLIKVVFTCPIPHPKQFSFIQISAISLLFGLNFLESLIWISLGINNFCGKITQPATIGPAKLPLPTSSAPATNLYLFSQSIFSNLNEEVLI